MKIWLKSPEKSYVITTNCVYRADVANHFKRKNGVGKSGFVCEFSGIDGGEYEIYVCSNNSATKTNKSIIVG